MAGMTIKPTSKYVLTNSAGVIFDQIDGGMVTYMRKVWFTLPPASMSPGDVPFWLSTQDYTDVFVYHYPTEMERFLTPDSAYKLRTHWKGTRKNKAVNQIGHNVQVNSPSPNPVSYVHSKTEGGYIPIEAIAWSGGIGPPTTPLPITTSGPFIHFTANLLFRTIPRVNVITSGILTVTGNWPFSSSTLWGSSVCSGLQYAMFIPGDNGAFIATRALMPDEVTGANSGANNNGGVIFPDNHPGVEIYSIGVTWKY